MNTRTSFPLFGLLATAVFSGQVCAQLNVGSDGSDGVLNLSTNTSITLDLAAAQTASWDTPSIIPGKGVYDPVQWAVVYKFSSLNFSQGALVFNPHPSGAPVVFLVQGDATINGEIVLAGQRETGTSPALPGPGGFRGGASFAPLVSGSAGFGPGGGEYTGARGGAGSYGTKGERASGPVYLNETCIPLIGGSGGSGNGPNSSTHGGGAGGGAILIACGGTLTVGGRIGAEGGDADNAAGAGSNGSGGAIRLVANRVVVTGNLFARGGNKFRTAFDGGEGRIRIESNTRSIPGTILPLPSVTASVPQNPKLWPDNTDPALRIVSVGSTTAPADPRSNFFDPDVPLVTGGNQSITVHANNVPTDGSWTVQVRMTPRNGAASFANCSFVSGNQASSVWQCTLNFDGGPGALIARAYANENSRPGRRN